MQDRTAAAAAASEKPISVLYISKNTLEALL